MRRLFLAVAILFAAMSDAQSPAEIARWEAQAKRVTIIRDVYGVPHIYGKTDADAVFGLLYTQCEENFDRIERNYLEMMGRRAEMEGEKVLYNDLLMRLIADTADAKKDYARAPIWLKKLLNAHADAINFYLYKHPETKPAVLTRFQPWFHLMYTDGSISATSTGGASVEEVKQFYDNPQAHSTAKIFDQYEIEDRGSNGFALAPSKSISGSAMLYINPHVTFYFRSEAQMVSEEGLNAYGAATWGQLFIYQGFNANCGWMHTTGYTDVADLYQEKVKQTDKGWVYEYEGKELSVSSKPITIYYTKDGQKLSKTFTGYYTHHGPVVAKRDGKWLALKEYNRSLKALIQSYMTTKAKNLAEYTSAMRGLSNTTNNTVYADNQGNIAYWHGNFVPRRDTGYNWALPVDGTTKKTEWTGVHPLEETVRLLNPANGWIQNCNATPFTAADKYSPVREKYPTYMAPDGQNARGINAARLLKEINKVDIDGLINVGYNRYLAAFDYLLPSLFEAYDACKDVDMKENLKKPIELLKAWNKESDTASIATTLAIDWAAQIDGYYPRARTREEGTEAIGRLEKIAATVAPQLKLKALAQVIENLKKKYGIWEVSWGSINRYQRLTGKFNEKFDDNQPSFAVALSSSRNGSLPAFESRSFDGTKGRYGFAGNSFIAAVEFGKRIKAKTIVTGGHSNDPSSPHFTDQALGHINGKFKTIFFYKDEVLKNKVEVYHPGEK